MFDYIKAHSGIVVSVLVVFVFGVVLGITSKADSDGVYFSANYPQGGTIFVIGKNTHNIAKLDLKSLNEAKTQVLASKIKNLATNDLLSSQLRDMANKGEGPFAAIPVVVRLHLTDEIAGPVAKACQNSPVFGNALVAYEAMQDQEHVFPIRGMMGINVLLGQLTDCSPDSDAFYDVWISKEYVKKWIQSAELPESGISVKASIVVAGIGI
jgi:hypothetical protein